MIMLWDSGHLMSLASMYQVLLNLKIIKNSQVKNWTFALIDEIESRFHVGYIKSTDG